MRLLSQVADGVFQVALAAYVVFSPEKQTSAAAIASAMAILLLPYSLVGPFAGVLLDRWRRRQVFLYGNLLRALLASATAALILSDVPDWLFYVSALCVTAVNRFVLAGLSAALPRVVDVERLVIANSLFPTAGTLATTIGGGLAFVVRLAVADSDAAVVLLGAGSVSVRGSRIVTHRPGTAPDRGLTRTRLSTALSETARDLAAALRHLAAPARSQAAWALAAMIVDAVLLRRPAVMLLMLLPLRPDVQSGRGARPSGAGVGYLRRRVLHGRGCDALGGGRYGPGGWIVRCAAAAAVLEPALGLPVRHSPHARRGFRPGTDHPGREDRHGHDRAVPVDDAFRGRIFSVYDVLFNVAFVGAAAVAALMLPPDGRSVPLVVTVAVCLRR